MSLWKKKLYEASSFAPAVWVYMHHLNDDGDDADENGVSHVEHTRIPVADFKAAIRRWSQDDDINNSHGLPSGIDPKWQEAIHLVLAKGDRERLNQLLNGGPATSVTVSNRYMAVDVSGFALHDTNNTGVTEASSTPRLRESDFIYQASYNVSDLKALKASGLDRWIDGDSRDGIELVNMVGLGSPPILKANAPDPIHVTFLANDSTAPRIADLCKRAGYNTHIVDLMDGEGPAKSIGDLTVSVSHDNGISLRVIRKVLGVFGNDTQMTEASRTSSASWSHANDKRAFKRDELAHELRDEYRGPSSAKTFDLSVQVPFPVKDQFKALMKGQQRWDNNKRVWKISSRDATPAVREQIAALGAKFLGESTPPKGMTQAQYSKEEGYDWLDRAEAARNRKPKIGDMIRVGANKPTKLLDITKRKIAAGKVATFYVVASGEFRAEHETIRVVTEDGSSRANFMSDIGPAPVTGNPPYMYRIVAMQSKKQVEVRANSGDDAIEAAIAKVGPSIMLFPIVVTNLDLHQTIHIANDSEYGAKINRVDHKSTLALEHSRRKR